jgi:hypothetical protein
MTATVAGIHLTGTHASRPAGNAVPDGSLYSCTTHNLIYQSNFAGNSWSTWMSATGLKWTTGTSMPGSPATNDRVTRTDLGLDFYYDGTRWLSTSLYREPFAVGNTLAPDTVGTALGRMAPWATAFDLWLVNWDITTYVATTNDGTKYWTLTFAKFIADDSPTSIDEFNTSADTVNTWTQRRRAIGASYVAATYRGFILTGAKTSTPGGIYFASAIEYRLIGV